MEAHPQVYYCAAFCFLVVQEGGEGGRERGEGGKELRTYLTSTSLVTGMGRWRHMPKSMMIQRFVFWS